jgi:hypothetical protein
MADPEVKLKFAGSSADADRAIATLERKIERLEQGAKQLSQKMKNAGKETSDAWSAAGRGVADFTAGLTGIGGPLDAALKTVQAFKAEFDDLVNRQQAAADANREFAKNLQNAANNSDRPLAEIRERMMSISETALITPQQSAKLLNIAQAAKGTLGENEVDSTIIAAAKVARLDQGTMEGLVNTSLDLQKQLPGTTAEQSIGFILNAMSKTRVPDTEKFTKNVLPGIIGVNKLDNTSIEYATALSAGITQAAGDTEGRKSRTAMTALALQLRDAFPELKDTEARVRAVQENPELRDAFLRGGTVNGKKLSKMKFDVTGPDGEVLQLDSDRASFERQMVPAIEQVLTKGTFAESMLNESLRDVPSLRNSGQEFRGRVKQQEMDETLILANRQIRGEVGTARTKVDDIAGASDAIDRQTVSERLSASGFGRFQRMMITGDAEIMGFLGGDYNRSLTSRLEDEKQSIEKFGQTFGMTETRVKQLEVLNEILKELRTGRVQKQTPPINRNGQVENN